jgi:hypothetical protein
MCVWEIFLIRRGCIFVFSAQLPEVLRENAYLYDGNVSGQTIYAYVGGNPLSNIDPKGLAIANPWNQGVGGGGGGAGGEILILGVIGIFSAMNSALICDVPKKDDKPCKLKYQNKIGLPPGKVRCAYKCPWYGAFIVRILDEDTCPEEVDWVPGNQGF